MPGVFTLRAFSMAIGSTRLTRVGCEIALNSSMLELLADAGSVGDHRELDRIAEGLQTAMLVKIGHNHAGDAKARVDVVTSMVGSWNSILLLVASKVIPQGVIRYGITGRV